MAIQRAWASCWSNEALAREAVEIAIAHNTYDNRVKIYTGSDWECALGEGPYRYATMREMYYMMFSNRRLERREMLEIPPGVGIWA